MQIITLLISLIIVRFIIRALFNAEWRKSAQAKIDGIKQERIFWRLVDGFEGIRLGINDIYMVHLDVQYLTVVFEHMRTKDDERILALLKRKKSIESLNMLFDAREKVEKTINELFVKNGKRYAKADIERSLKIHKNEQSFVPEQYDKLVSHYLDFLPDQTTLKDVDVWNARKRLEKFVRALEWKTEDVRVEAEILFALGKSEMEIGKAVMNILCGKDSPDDKLRDSLTDLEHIKILRSCINDFVVPWINTNYIHRFMWKIIAEVAGV